MENWGKELYKKIPTNMRLFGESLVGVKDPITEKDFTREELNAMRRQIIEAQDRSNNMEAYLNAQLQEELDNPSGYYGKANGKDVTREQYIADLNRKINSFEKTRNKTSVDPYGRNNTSDAGVGGGFLETMDRSFNSPEYNISTTLGRYNAYQNPDNSMTVKDRYDWTKSGGREPTIGEAIRAFGRAFPNPEGMGNVMMRYWNPDVSRDVNVNLGQGTGTLTPEEYMQLMGK